MKKLPIEEVDVLPRVQIVNDDARQRRPRLAYIRQPWPPTLRPGPEQTLRTASSWVLTSEATRRQHPPRSGNLMLLVRVGRHVRLHFLASTRNATTRPEPVPEPKEDTEEFAPSRLTAATPPVQP